MSNRRVALLALLCFASCLVQAQDLSIEELPPQGGIVGQHYELVLTASGGAQPYSWHLLSGELPPGCRLHAHTGKISGVPSAAGDYSFTVAVHDSNVPQMQIQRAFTIHVIEGLTVDWQEAPKVHGNAIQGSAIVSNQTPHEVVLTLVVVAVNEIGRATTLGYQHFTLAAQETSPVIPFGSSPGLGTYYVRADAVAHRPGHHHVYRASKQESDLKLTRF